MITIRTDEQLDALVDELGRTPTGGQVTVAQTAHGTLAISTIIDNRSKFAAYIKPDGQVTRPS